MKIYSMIFAGIILTTLTVDFVFAQSKFSHDSLPSQRQIMPKFSEMVDYVNTVPSARYSISGGRGPVSNQITADGSIRTSSTGEIVVPAELPNQTKIKREKAVKFFKKKTTKK